MSEKTLTQSAFEKIHGCAQGNGIDVSKIELLGSDEITLTVKAEMMLRLDMTREKASYQGGFRNAKGIPKTRAIAITENQLEFKITELKTTATKGGYWCKDAARQIKAEAGHGWGLEKADVILDSLTHVYYCETPCSVCMGKAMVNCEACRAIGHVPCYLCRETGFEVCGGCNGTGQSNMNPEQNCSQCNGTRQVYCRDCRGQRQMQCNNCRGQRQVKCNGCGGNGKSTKEEYVAPVAKAEFRIIDSADLPGGFRRAISRAGTKTLSKGHATISAGELVEQEGVNPVIPYTAVLPFADMRLRINGKPMRCSLLGHKGVILDLPAFLDAALEPRIKAFEENIKSPETLSKALEIRVCREAFGLLQMNKADAKMLRQLYPAGLSPEMATRILVLMRKLVHGQTITTRIVAAAVSVLIFAAVYYCIVESGVRMMIAGAAKPFAVLLFDVGLCISGYFLQNYVLQLAAARKLQRQLGASGIAKSQSTGGVGIIAGICVMAVYIIMLIILKAPPVWPAIIAMPFG